MAKKFSDCVAEAIRGGHINADEGQQALKWYNSIRATGADDAKAKTLVAQELEHQARQRERRTIITAGKIADAKREMGAFRNAAGEADLPLAHRLQFFGRGDEGKFNLPAEGNMAMSVYGIMDGILSTVSREMEQVQFELRRGAITGDLRRTSKIVAALVPGAAKTQATVRDVVRAMRGEKVDDPRAAELAQIMMDTAEKLRLRFNEAGGEIGKLEGWGGPQAHNSEALLNAGREAWISFIGERLDREKMIHPATKRKLTDAELRESLEVVWERIVNNGYIDEEKITGVAVGRGALWSQHADHRFLHFKSADAWLEYAEKFGGRDPYASFMSWVRLMARDIAAMEKFGPNPDVTIAYLQKWIEAKSQQTRSTKTIISEQRARLKEIASRFEVDNPEYTKLSAELDQVLADIESARADPAWTAGGIITTALGMRGRADEIMAQWRERLDAAYAKLVEIQGRMKDVPPRVQDMMAHQEFAELFDEIREPVDFAAVANPVDYARLSLERTRRTWDAMKGANSVPVSFVLSNVMRTVGGWTSLTMLPMAVLSALADPVFGATKRMRLGMNFGQWNPVSVLIDTIRYMSQSNRREAMQSGVIWDSAFNAFQVEAAYASKLAKARGVTSYVADRVHAVGLLTPYTAAGKASMQMKLMAEFANAAGSAWGELRPEVRDTLERGGFDAAAWDKVRAATLYEPRPGAPFLRPNEIFDIDPKLSERYIAMIARETRYAVIEPTPESRSFVLGNTRPGTYSGEIVRAGAMLKGFPIAVLFQWWGQMSNDIRGGNNTSAMATAASLIVTGSVMGLFAMAMKDMAAGRDPRKWLDEETYLDGNVWLAALLQAGGLGIYGDLLFSEVNRSGGSLAQTVAGPLVERVDTVKKLTMDNLIQAARGKETNFGRELTRFLRQNTPNVLWTRLAMDRMVWDQFQKMVDPSARQSWQRDMSKRKKDYGQEFWWPLGESSPARAPDLSRVISTRK